MSATKIPAQHVLRRSGDEMKCLYCSYTEPLDPPRSPAQPDAVELLRELVACKDLKDEAEELQRRGYTGPDYYWRMEEYNRRKPLAWSAARAFLRGGSGG